MTVRSSAIFKGCAALSVLIIVLHGVTLWAAPFASLYPTAPAMLILVAFLAIFLLCARLVIARSAGSARDVPASPNLMDQAFGDRRLRAFLLLVSLAGIALHVWSKYYLIELRPISCISEIRFAWLEVDRSMLPVHIRLGSILGHLLTSFAYLGMLAISYTMGRSGSVRAVCRSDIALQLFFTFVGSLYAGFIGSRNAMLAFLVMNLVGLMLGLEAPEGGKKPVRRWRLALVTLAMPLIGMVAFSSAIFSDRLTCHEPDALVKFQGHGLSAGKIAAYHMTGNYREFALKARTQDDGAEWRETLFVERCPVCGPALVYANHGIFNLSKVLASDERGRPILLSYIAAWGKRIGLNIRSDGENGVRVYGPGGITLAGAAYHDYGVLGVVLVAAVLGLLFGQSINWMASSGSRVIVGAWLFSVLFYVLIISSIFVGFSILPFPFITFGIGVGLMVWMLLFSGLRSKRRRSSVRPNSSSLHDIDYRP